MWQISCLWESTRLLWVASMAIWWYEVGVDMLGLGRGCFLIRVLE